MSRLQKLVLGVAGIAFLFGTNQAARGEDNQPVAKATAKTAEPRKSPWRWRSAPKPTAQKNIFSSLISEEVMAGCEVNNLPAENCGSFYFGMEYVALKTEENGDRSRNFLYGGGADNQVAAGPDTVDQGTSGSIRYILGVDTGDCGERFEISYLSAELDGSATVNSNGIPFYLNPDQNNQPIVNPAGIIRNTDVVDAEFNYFTPENCISTKLSSQMLLGFRYINVTENLQIDGTANPAAIDYQSEGENSIPAVQVGTEVVLNPYSSGNRNLDIALTGKAGAGLNNHSFNGQHALTGGASGTFSDQTVSTFFDLGVEARIAVSKRLTINGGYEVLYVNGLDLGGNGTDDFGGSDNFIGTEANDNLVIGGFTVGGQVNF